MFKLINNTESLDQVDEMRSGLSNVYFVLPVFQTQFRDKCQQNLHVFVGKSMNSTSIKDFINFHWLNYIYGKCPKISYTKWSD